MAWLRPGQLDLALDGGRRASDAAAKAEAAEVVVEEVAEEVGDSDGVPPSQAEWQPLGARPLAQRPLCGISERVAD